MVVRAPIIPMFSQITELRGVNFSVQKSAPVEVTRPKVRASAVLGRDDEAVVEFELVITAVKGHGLRADILSVGPGNLGGRLIRQMIVESGHLGGSGQGLGHGLYSHRYIFDFLQY